MSKICVRCGDQDDYHLFDTLSEVGDHLGGMGVVTPLERYGVTGPNTTYGFETEEYRGPHNYISLYRSDEDYDPICELTEEEVARVNHDIKEWASTR